LGRIVGFIGAGNMAEAIIAGMARDSSAADRVSGIRVYDISPERMDDLKKKYGVFACETAEQLLQESDLCILSVKPNVAKDVLKNIKVNNICIVSIVTGLTYKQMTENMTAKGGRFLRVMPNTPLMAGEGASVFATPHTLLPEEIQLAECIFSGSGIVKYVEEAHLPAVTGLSGSGPAYVYIFIEALADAGVKNGLPRTLALELAAQTVLGAAKLVKQSELHPGVLKDNVCSPGGTTIEGVAILEQSGFRGAVIQAVDASAEKARKL